MLRPASSRAPRPRGASRQRAPRPFRPLCATIEALEERRLLSVVSHRAATTAYLPHGMTRADLISQYVQPAPVVQAAVPPSAALVSVGETEPNNTAATADALPLGFDAGEDAAVDVSGSLSAGDLDYFALDLNAGDILGANVFGATTLSLRNAADSELIGSQQDATSLHPDISPLPGGGDAALSWVVATPGTYYLRVTGGSGAYNLNLRVFRPALERESFGAHQTLFLDFDGATIDMSIFGGSGNATLSPLSSFLAGWGLAAGDESAVIDSIVAAVTESLSEDLRARGNNGDFDATGIPGQFDIEILNSRDHADPFGQPHVSRIIIGGSIAEFGIATIGLAQSIDVGNFDTAETAVVLLDLLSAPADNPNSLNQFPLGGGATIVDIIGAGVGNITAHEAGHYFGNWHTNQFNASANLMDQGGNLPNTVGIGPDGIFGTTDDVDVDFGPDAFVPNEGFTGVEDTLNTMAFGLSTGGVAELTIGADVTLFEGDAGTLDAVFSVFLANPSDAEITIAFTTLDQTAVAPGDYQPASGTLTFLPGGSLVQTITVKVVGDLAVEGNETFLVRLLGRGGLLLGKDTAVGTILNDDVELSINDVSVVESHLGTKNVVFTVSTFGTVNLPITFLYTTLDGTASAPNDYTFKSGAVSIPVGGSSAQITVTVLADSLDEADADTFFVLLTSPQGARLAKALGTATIIDDDALPGLYVNDVQLTTTAAGQLAAVFTVALNTASGRNVTVHFATADGAALNGLDYFGQTGMLTFPQGTLNQQVTVPVMTAADYSANKKFYLNLSQPAGAQIMDGQGAATIVFAPGPVGEYILDDNSPGYTRSLSGWTNATNTLAYNLDYDYAAAGNGSTTATWSFLAIPNGSYQVFARWVPFTNRATNAPFTISTGTPVATLGTVLVNQQLAPTGDVSNGITWQSLGTFTAASNKLIVRLANNANGFIVADAIRIVGGGIGPQSPEMDVAGSGTSIDTGDATPAAVDGTDFGSVAALSGTVVRAFTITNNGNAPLQLTGNPPVVVSGAHAADFTVLAQPAASVAPGQQTTFQVQFRPGATGLRSATIAIANNDDSEHPYTFAVQGTGLGPPQSVFLVDDSMPGYSQSGAWATSTDGSGLLGQQRSTAAGGGATATWLFGGLAAGTYDVYATWAAGEDRATNAPFTVSNLAGNAYTLFVNQRQAPPIAIGGVNWGSLGIVEVSGGALQVTLGNSANGAVVADAVLVVRHGTPLPAELPLPAANPPAQPPAQENPPAVFLAHNAALPQDVNADGRVTPGDVLVIVNRLLSGGAGAIGAAPLAATSSAPRTYYVDVNRDGRVTPNDALLVINHLLAHQPPAAAPAAAVDAALVLFDDTAAETVAVAHVETPAAAAGAQSVDAAPAAAPQPMAAAAVDEALADEDDDEPADELELAFLNL